jgi:hypothetical protein
MSAQMYSASGGVVALDHDGLRALLQQRQQPICYDTLIQVSIRAG